MYVFADVGGLEKCHRTVPVYCGRVWQGNRHGQWPQHSSQLFMSVKQNHRVLANLCNCFAHILCLFNHLYLPP